MKFSDLVNQLAPVIQASSLDSQPAPDVDFTGIAAIADAGPGQLSYIEGEKYAHYLATTQASGLILPNDPALQAQANDRNLPWVAAADPRLAFAQGIALFYQPFQPAPEVHPTAVIHPSVTLGEQVHIGAHVVIQPGVVIGNQVCIHPNVTLYPEAKIGDRSVLHANCVIQERSQIGADCVIHAGAVVGSEGFGFVPTPQGMVKMHQSGHVVLEDNVEVGCNTTIDRPATGETRIGRNTKLDNLVQIGHGCRIGQSSAISAQVGMAGRVIVGNGVLLAGQVGVSNDVSIGDGAIATAQAGLHRDVGPKEIVSGTPAVSNKIWLKVSAIYNRLPEMYQTVRQLKRQLKS